MTEADIPMLARLHVACWQETYSGLLPAEEIAARGFETRRKQWTNGIARGTSRIALVPDLGFAQAGPQRDAALAKMGYPQELYVIYLLRRAQGQGLGRALLQAVTDPQAGPMTALVLAQNASAIAFYRSVGGQLIDKRAEHIGQAAIIEHAYGWDPLTQTITAAD